MSLLRKRLLVGAAAGTALFWGTFALFWAAEMPRDTPFRVKAIFVGVVFVTWTIGMALGFRIIKRETRA